MLKIQGKSIFSRKLVLSWHRHKDSASRIETFGDGLGLWDVEVPSRFHDRPLEKFTAYPQEHYQGILIGIYTVRQGLSLEDLLSEEPSAIDDFFPRKFAEIKMTHLLGRTKVDCQINPPSTLTLVPHQYGMVIASQMPSL